MEKINKKFDGYINKENNLVSLIDVEGNTTLLNIEIGQVLNDLPTDVYISFSFTIEESLPDGYYMAKRNSDSTPAEKKSYLGKRFDIIEHYSNKFPIEKYWYAKKEGDDFKELTKKELTKGTKNG